MESLSAVMAYVPWQHWAALAGVSWTFALVCFVGYHYPRRRRTPTRPQLTLVPGCAEEGLPYEEDRAA
jgi:hypothetical protein